MSSLKSQFLATITERGFLHQCTDADGLDALLSAGKPVTAYIGFDCTADSLHVGSLVQIMLLRWFQKCGHRPIVLMGGGTTKVGDPSGKDASRQLLSEGQIAANMAGIRRNFDAFLKFGDGPTDAVMANNADWLDSLSYIPFLRDYGRHFSVNRMLGFDSVKLRLDREQPLSFLEFNYMVLQAYDFLELARRYDCALQMGGSDQWGNIVCGVELGRRVGNFALYGLTAPLITTASGEKMGKTAQGAVWLSRARTSEFQYYQFWRNTQDGDVARFLKLFTELPLSEIAKLSALRDSEINEAKKTLAFEATKLLFDETAAREAAETTRLVFEKGESAEGLPRTPIAASELSIGVPAFRLFVSAGLVSSSTEARKLIRQGGARLNNEVIKVETKPITSSDIKDGVIKISAGTKRHVLIVPTSLSADAKVGTVIVTTKAPAKFTTDEDKKKT